MSRNGEVSTTLRFNWGTNMPQTVLLVRERLDNARAQLPERAEDQVPDEGEMPAPRGATIVGPTGGGRAGRV